MIKDKERLARYRQILKHKAKQAHPYMDCAKCPAKRYFGECPNCGDISCWQTLYKWAEGKYEYDK